MGFLPRGADADDDGRRKQCRGHHHTDERSTGSGRETRKRLVTV
jgi:hypothetical protein